MGCIEWRRWRGGWRRQRGQGGRFGPTSPPPVVLWCGGLRASPRARSVVSVLAVTRLGSNDASRLIVFCGMPDQLGTPSSCWVFMIKKGPKRGTVVVFL